uniref:Pectinesterase inhibitor domain-containing protein n=1 Tax=Nelumbo nucifera TaxID=4432 RepID=A0A822ZC24_NELNU|nr:TPA_asm: hypothetical protein HUJ06_002004 [Nelumbo nucifera]
MGRQEWLAFGLLIWGLGGQLLAWSLGVGDNLHSQCSFTRYPDLCVETMLGSGLGHGNIDIVSALVKKSMDETKFPTPDSSNPLYDTDSLKAQHSNDGHCLELMNMSLKRLNQSLLALKSSHSTTKRKNDIQTWLSAALTFQETCRDSLEGLSGSLVDQISSKMDYLSRLTSNALALANRFLSNPRNNSSRHLTSMDDFPKWVSARDRKLLQSTEIKANAVVAKDGSGNYKTISEAIEAASGGRFVIYVKSGTYKEAISTNKDGITLIGDGKYSTIIVGDDSVGGGSSLRGSATFGNLSLSLLHVAM